jgi:hypothetical protein
MTHFVRFLSLGAGIAALSVFGACSSGSGTPTADAGHNNIEGTGGAGAGGDTSVTDVGGTTGTNTSTSNNHGTGGTTSAGATTVIDPFSTLAQQQLFLPSTYVPTDCSVNVAAPKDSGASLSVDWSGSVDINADSTTPGSMKVTASFTNWNQKWAVEMNGPTDSLGNPLDLTNKLVTADIRISDKVSPNPSYPYGAQIYVKTGSDYVWGASKWTNIQATGTWIRLALDTTNPDGVPAGSTFDPRAPIQLGVTLSTGGAGESTYCTGNYGAAFGAPQTTTAYIDQIQIEPRP